MVMVAINDRVKPGVVISSVLTDKMNTATMFPTSFNLTPTITLQHPDTTCEANRRYFFIMANV